uniref:Uncharacterized protein n=1 Tax=Pithovirus LCPAC302 TaxID=2506593 RepID=A0A481Z833_9VIRU|nr:MAG: hypothetical protein LCPAC302_01420 [Pithovirus LCPAC302]
MEFVKNSTKSIYDWSEWIETNVKKSSSLYELFNKMLDHFPLELTYAGSIPIYSPYVFWIELLQSDIKVEKMTKCRYKVITGNTIVAFIEKYDKGYKYVGISSKCLSKIMNRYMSQMI